MRVKVINQAIFGDIIGKRITPKGIIEFKVLDTETKEARFYKETDLQQIGD